MRNILISSSFYADWEIVRTDILKDEMDKALNIHFNGCYFDEWLVDKGYTFTAIASSCNDDNMDDFEISEKYFDFDYYED